MFNLDTINRKIASMKTPFRGTNTDHIDKDGIPQDIDCNTERSKSDGNVSLDAGSTDDAKEQHDSSAIDAK